MSILKFYIAGNPSSSAQGYGTISRAQGAFVWDPGEGAFWNANLITPATNHSESPLIGAAVLPQITVADPSSPPNPDATLPDSTVVVQSKFFRSDVPYTGRIQAGTWSLSVRVSTGPFNNTPFGGDTIIGYKQRIGFRVLKETAAHVGSEITSAVVHTDQRTIPVFVQGYARSEYTFTATFTTTEDTLFNNEFLLLKPVMILEADVTDSLNDQIWFVPGNETYMLTPNFVSSLTNANCPPIGNTTKEEYVYITPDGVTYSLELNDRFVLTDEGTGTPPIEYITQRGPFQHGVTLLDYRLQPRVVQPLA